MGRMITSSERLDFLKDLLNLYLKMLNENDFSRYNKPMLNALIKKTNMDIEKQLKKISWEN